MQIAQCPFLFVAAKSILMVTQSRFTLLLSSMCPLSSTTAANDGHSSNSRTTQRETHALCTQKMKISTVDDYNDGELAKAEEMNLIIKQHRRVGTHTE